MTRPTCLWILLLSLSCIGPLPLQAQRETVEHEGNYQKNLTYTGPITGDEIIYTVYLPPGHDTEKGPYPLIIFLHGAGGGNSSAKVMESYEAARKDGLIRDAIFVFPEKYGGTVWRDGAKDKSAETNVIKELLPYLQKQHGATKSRAQTTIMGFSMGAAGSIFWGGKYLDTFSIAVALDAGGGTSATDETVRNYVPEYATQTKAIQEKLKLRLVQGGLNTKGFRETLDELEIPYDFEQLPLQVTDYPEGSSCLNKKDPTKKMLHNPACMVEGQWGRNTWSFIEKHLSN